MELCLVRQVGSSPGQPHSSSRPPRISDRTFESCKATCSSVLKLQTHSPIKIEVRGSRKYRTSRERQLPDERSGRNWSDLRTLSNFRGLKLTKLAVPSIGLKPSRPTLSGAQTCALPEAGLGSSIQVLDLAPLLRNWNDFVNSADNSEVLRNCLERFRQPAAVVVSRGSELSESVRAKLADNVLPVLMDDLDRWERSAATILDKGFEILGNITTESVEIALASQSSRVLGQSSNIVNSPTVEKLGQSLSRFVSIAGSLGSEFGSQVGHLTGDFVHLDSTAFSHSAAQRISEIATFAGVYYDGLGANAAPITATALVAATGSTIAVVSSYGSRRRTFVEGADLPLRYDPTAIASYFKRRPVDVFFRSLKIMVECSALTGSIIFDWSWGRARQNERRRAVQLVDLITKLGPTAIKIGQALSIRPDILPVVYLEELQKLQDRVPSFPNEEAKVLIFQGLGKTAEEVFSEMSESPVAAASLGQVYRARLRDTGELVAVKVQRPGVLEGISRDLFLLRAAAYLLQAFPLVHSDLVALLDTWAFRFFDELDYVQEGRNAEQFADNMKSLANVTVPAVYPRFTSRKACGTNRSAELIFADWRSENLQTKIISGGQCHVSAELILLIVDQKTCRLRSFLGDSVMSNRANNVLTTQWIEGEKLSECRTDDLLPLVSTALNCYLVQLLESGFLHADPHPGNLLRTPDGRLCVLDFGLMTQVTEDQRYALIEYISHLVNSDYGKVAEDLVKLGFVPPDMEDPEKTAAVVPQLTRVLGQLVQGGGARNINIQQVTDDLANMAKDYVFVLPPYFALILRAFSVLEGIGLEADPNYTIVDECYPYISKRLLTDDSPRTRAALKDFLYGGKGQLDMQRVEEIVEGFQSFRDVMARTESEGRPRQKSQGIDPTTKEALSLIFAPEGSYIQELLLTELVRAVDALSREALAELWRLISATLKIPGIPLPSPLFAPGSWPLPLPGLFFGMIPVAKLSAEDEQSLDTVRRIWRLLEPSFILPSPADIMEIAQEMIPLFFNLFPGVTAAAQRFTAMLFQRLALRFADDLDGTNSVREWNKDPMASARHIQPLRLSMLQKEEQSGNGSRF